MASLAEVRIWDERVGALAYEPKTGVSTFEYDPRWLAHGSEIAPIHMPRAATLYRFPGLAPETYRGLPAVFADTLPDDFGNAVINAWLARKGRDPLSFTPVERLLYTGRRGMGALEYTPELERETGSAQALELGSLVSMAQRVLDERGSLQEGVEPGVGNAEAMLSILQVGTSAGGARAKAVVAINADRSQLRSGQADAPEGFEHYLLKFDGVEEHRTQSEAFGDPQGYGRMEYAYYQMAVDAGLAMSPSELLHEGARAHFLTRRFDRIGNRKLHYVSLCGMDHADYKLPGSYSYEQLLSVARRLKLPRADAIEIFRRMVFNVVARNHDDHSKNFGFICRTPGARWELSPAFDVAYSYKPGSPWVNAHQLTLNGKRDDFEREDLMAVAALIGNFKRDALKVIDRALAVVAEWPAYARRAGVFQGLIEEVQPNLRLGL